MKEIWRYIKGYEGLYLISNFGNGESLRERKVPLKPLKNKDGYLYFILTDKDGKRHTCYIHRLVANAFVANDDPVTKTEINHKDQNKNNNRFDNLEWCDRDYNLKYGDCIERGRKARKKKTVQMDMNGNDINIWDSPTDAALNLNINKNGIYMCCRGLINSSGGFKWKYA